MLAAVMMAAFIAAMENSIVATAMPDDGRQALADSTCSAGHLPAYLLTQAATIPIYGRLADLYGRKPVFFARAGLFFLASTLCGLAWGMLPRVLFRALQGTGAGAIQPIAITIIGDIHQPTERARVQGYISGVFGVAAIIGPMLLGTGRWWSSCSRPAMRRAPSTRTSCSSNRLTSAAASGPCAARAPGRDARAGVEVFGKSRRASGSPPER